MAQEKKYKLGELEFETEQEYREAAGDLKRIKGLMSKYDVSNPEQARKILASIKAHPETFRSPYGRKFVEKLEKTVSRPVSVTPITEEPAAASRSVPGVSAATQKKENGKREKRKREKPPKAESGAKKEKLQIFTIRNFIIGIIIVAGIVVFSLFAPRLFSLNNNSTDSSSVVKRNMVTAYAKNQADLKAQLYTYYFNIVGKTEDEAMKDAQEGIRAYVLDLSEQSISTMTEDEITDTYNQLVEGGDIQNNSFVEPSSITVLKEKLLAAGLANQSSNGVEGETAVIAAVNSMMDYQERIFYALCHNYSLLGYSTEDCEEYATEDLTAMFDDVIYNFSMSEDEKEVYYESFLKKGLIKDNQVVRFSTDPTAYNLPDLTPAIEISFNGESADAFHSSMISYTPAASVFYEIHSDDDETGFICFRNNGDKSQYIQIDADTSVTAQGDFFIVIGKNSYTGQWFYNKQDIGLFMNGNQDSKISYVYDLTY